MSLCSKEPERERLEKEFSEKSNAYREELERKSEEEKAALYKELEYLRQQKSNESGMVSNKSESYPTVTESEAYHRMQRRGVDIADRVVVGKEQDHVLSFQNDGEDEVFSKRGTRTPVDKNIHNVGNIMDGCRRTRSDSFMNILSDEERALRPGLPDRSIVRQALASTFSMYFCLRKFVWIDHHSFEVRSDDEDSEPEFEPEVSEVDFPGAVASDVDSPGAVASSVPVIQVIDTTVPTHDRLVYEIHTSMMKSICS